jgi:hypothetical protein
LISGRPKNPTTNPLEGSPVDLEGRFKSIDHGRIIQLIKVQTLKQLSIADCSSLCLTLTKPDPESDPPAPLGGLGLGSNIDCMTQPDPPLLPGWVWALFFDLNPTRFHPDL